MIECEKDMNKLKARWSHCATDAARPRRHHRNPAEAPGGREERSHRLAVRCATTHALFAGKVQRKVRNCVAQLAAAGSFLDRPKIAAIPAISAMLAQQCQHPRLLRIRSRLVMTGNPAAFLGRGFTHLAGLRLASAARRRIGRSRRRARAFVGIDSPHRGAHHHGAVGGAGNTPREGTMTATRILLALFCFAAVSTANAQSLPPEGPLSVANRTQMPIQCCAISH
jgi:hypothetical protein